MMSEEEITFLSLPDAVALVGAIQEEEDIERADKRIFTVYSKDDKELCWFDFEEVLADVGPVSSENEKEAVQNYILAHIPSWAVEM